MALSMRCRTTQAGRWWHCRTLTSGQFLCQTIRIISLIKTVSCAKCRVYRTNQQFNGVSKRKSTVNWHLGQWLLGNSFHPWLHSTITYPWTYFFNYSLLDKTKLVRHPNVRVKYFYSPFWDGLLEKGHRFGFDLVWLWSCFGFNLDSIWSWFGSELGHSKHANMFHKHKTVIPCNTTTMKLYQI